MNGTVKFFNESKGYGFITADDGSELFVHISGLKEGVRLREGDAVTFDVEQGDRGPKAVNVSMGSGAAPSEAPAEEAPVEETPAQEEAPAEEPAQEEAPVEQAPAEESSEEAAPAEETTE